MERRNVLPALVGFLVCVIMAEPPWHTAAAQDVGSLTTVILVRHAEKADDGRDPPLNAAGRERAGALTHALGNVEVGAIYATQFERTRATAQPLADALGMEVTVINAARGYVQEMAELIRSNHQGDVAVVVSHSNTVPAIINALGGGPAPPITEDDYDDLFILTLSPSGTVRLLNLHYGRKTP